MRGRGPSFARTLRAHTRFLEQNKVIHDTKRKVTVNMMGLLGDEDVCNYTKAWLRTLKAGTVSAYYLLLK
jgi:hypothetical protein